ncbi:hypothetical protein BCR33DRAFT_740024 [Rhizoclosmatium globosum]|uniref:DUF829-domain-containing protein n=1 Tax=Rhizoclosmatium globosum TaxID=329046 RepID=A0A1Y2C432_9FUNG|nr:hypothetical protein BCR33DRAFT_740024 [Rhizoclosmatium globosum]|eukprot:ORY41065.1 hypothetical protein BCR33DRAFT_740024 [Rhizoclosmatium globosum]
MAAQASTSPVRVHATGPVALSPAEAQEFADYEQVGPAWIAKPTAHHIFAGKRYVIIFGWLDAPFSEVEKYAQYYRSNGFTVIILIGTTDDIDTVWAGKGKEKYVNEFEPLVSFLEANKLVEPTGTPKSAFSLSKLVVHALSKGGILKMMRTVNALHAKGYQLKSQALLLDSAPSATTAASWARYNTAEVKGPIVKRLSFGAAFALAFVGKQVIDMKKYPFNQAIPYTISTNNEDGNVNGARLFLYSQADTISLPSEINAHANLARDEGISVEEKVFISSGHLKHAVDFKDEYWVTVDSFLKRNVH